MSVTIGSRLPEPHSATEAQCCDSGASRYAEVTAGSRVQGWVPCHNCLLHVVMFERPAIFKRQRVTRQKMEEVGPLFFDA